LPPTITLAFPPTKQGFAEARLDLDRLEQTLEQEWTSSTTPASNDAGATASAPASAPAASPAVVVYERSVKDGRSRELLETIGGGKANGLLPSELGPKLAPGPGGKALSKASVRAVIRNIQKLEGHLLAEGAISRRVILIDFSGYDQEGAGRYYISDGDRTELDGHLGRP
jgi:hypothetical protein